MPLILLHYKNLEMVENPLMRYSFIVAATILSDMDKMPTVKLGDYTLQIEIEELSSEVREIARKELRETPDVRDQAVKELRELLKGMIHT